MCLRRTDTLHPVRKGRTQEGGGARGGEGVSRAGQTGQDEHGLGSAVMRVSYLLGFVLVGAAAALKGCAEPFLVITVIRGNYQRRRRRLRAESVALLSRTVYLVVACFGFLLADV
eukprot:GHVU01182004.1.p1 GENE.GHVU01182004.1~~GHVU01182004.1.p1  ORF type:complete len:115 (+),score=15.88 GHVU01182004.1:62-406(+)